MAKKRQSKQAGGGPGELRRSAHRIWLAGLGALAAAEEEGGKLFKSLVDRGAEFEARGKQGVDRQLGKVRERAREAVDAVESGWERVETGLDKSVTTALNRIGVPTRKEIRDLAQRVEELTRSVERLAGGATKPRRRKAASRKKSAKKAAGRKTTGRKRPARTGPRA